MKAVPSSAPDEGSRLQTALARGLRALDDRGITWCLLRGGTHTGGTGDVDLLVSPAAATSLPEVLASSGFVRLPSWGYGTHTFFVARGEADDWVKLDVVSELAFGRAFELPTDAAGGCLDRRHREGHVWVMHPEDAFWALLLHRLLDKGSLDEGSVARLRALRPWANGGGPLAAVVADVVPPPWSVESILEQVDGADVADLERRVAPALARAWALRAASEVARRRRSERAARVRAKVATAWRRAGLRVAVLGPDGAGKSTLIEGIRRSFPLPVRTIYLAPFPSGSGRSGWRLPGLGLMRRLVQLWRAWIVGRVHVARGRLVLFDRHPVEARLANRRDGGLAGRARRWIIGRSCPVPELVLVLDVPGSIAYARARERDPDTLESERRGYRELASRLPSATVLDASGDADALRRRAADIVWRACTARWRPR